MNIDECLMGVPYDKLDQYNRSMDQNIDHLVHKVDTKFKKKKQNDLLLKYFIDF